MELKWWCQGTAVYCCWSIWIWTWISDLDLDFDEGAWVLPGAMGDLDPLDLDFDLDLEVFKWLWYGTGSYHMIRQIGTTLC